MTTEYFKENNLLHRIGGPAVIFPYTMREEWFYAGNRHNPDGPAITQKNTPTKSGDMLFEFVADGNTEEYWLFNEFLGYSLNDAISKLQISEEEYLELTSLPYQYGEPIFRGLLNRLV